MDLTAARSNIRRPSMTMPRVSRRTFLRATVAGAAVVGFPHPLRAQAKTFKIGVVHPVTGPLAEPGQACRLGAQMAADAINAAGGVKALGGAKLELLLGDTQTKPDVGRSEAERVVNQGAQMLMGSFDSGSTAAMVPVAQQRRIPFLVDIAAADPITANVAKAVREGQQTVQYVYRNFPTGASFGRKAVEYFSEIFKEAVEHVMSAVPWRNFKTPRTAQVAEDYRKRSGGKTFDTNSGYSYDGMFLIAAFLDRAKSTEPEAIVEAIKKPNYTAGLMQYAGPIVFNELGDNPNAVTTMIQILGQKPVAVWPREAALAKFVFPRPK